MYKVITPRARFYEGKVVENGLSVGMTPCGEEIVPPPPCLFPSFFLCLFSFYLLAFSLSTSLPSPSSSPCLFPFYLLAFPLPSFFLIAFSLPPLIAFSLPPLIAFSLPPLIAFSLPPLIAFPLPPLLAFPPE